MLGGLLVWPQTCLPQPTLFESHEILSQTPDAVTLRIVYRFPHGKIRFRDFMSHYFLVSGDSLIAFPASRFLFTTVLKQPEAEVLKTRGRNLSIPENLDLPAERVIGDSAVQDQQQPWRFPLGIQTSPILNVQKLGNFRDFPLWALRVFPVKILPGGKSIAFLDTIVVRLKFGGAILGGSAKIKRENPAILQELKQMLLNPGAVKNVQAASHLHVAKPSGFRLADRKIAGFKLLVSGQGWYKITRAFLKANKIPVEQVAWNRIRITAKENPVPFVAHGLADGRFDPGDSFEFWGEPNLNTRYPGAEDMYFDPYSIKKAYFVTWNDGPGAQYGAANGGFFSSESTLVFQPRSFMATVHAEKDNSYNRLGHVMPGVDRDHWFWGSLGAGEIRTFPVKLLCPDIQSNRLVKVKLMLHGMTTGHHSVRAFLSNHRILQGEWNDQTLYSVATSQREGVFGGELDEKNNALTLINNSDDELDFFLVNWFDVTYPRLYEADENFIRFTRPEDWQNGRYRFVIKGFTRPNIEIFKLHQSQIFGARVDEIVDSLGQKSYQLTFEDDVPSAQTAYIALTPEAKMNPESAQPVYESNLKNPDNQADYVIITPPYFAENDALRRLIHLRQSQGYSVRVALTDEIYDNFSDGEKSPVGIKNFLRYACTTWQKPAPLFVLLVGDGNYAVRSRSAQSVNFVPVYHYQTIKFGAAASDTWYALVSGDDLVPDYFIGRLPARTHDELNHMLEKILSTETQPVNGEWRNRLLMIAGHDKFFHQQNAELARTLLPKSFFVQKLTSSPPGDPFYGDTRKLLSAFDRGVSYANFMGHGGGAVWADNLLFRFDDLRLLKNAPNYPLITSMTCFTAAFDSPRDVSCLGEQLLKLDRQGAVAFLGASGVGWVWNDYYFLQQLINRLFIHRASTIGEAVTLAKIDYQAKYFTAQRESMIHQYNLLGDPALGLAFPKDSLRVSSDQKRYSGGDTVRVKISAPVQTGTLSYILVDSIGVVKKTGNLPYSDPQKPISIILSQTMKPGLYWLTFDLFGPGSLANYNGAFPVAVGQAMMISTGSVPATVVVGDSVKIHAQIAGLSPAARAFCVFESPLNDSLEMAFLPDRGRFETLQSRVFQNVGWVTYHISSVENGKMHRFAGHTFRVNPVGDLRVQQNSLQVAVDDSIYLQAVIQNNSAVAYKGISVDFWQVQTGDSVLLGKCVTDFNPYETRKIKARVVLPPGKVDVKVSVNFDRTIRERVWNNNSVESLIETPAFYFLPEKGFRVSLTQTDSVCAWRNVHLQISKHSCGIPFVLSFGNAAWSDFKTDQSIEPVSLPDWSGPVLKLNGTAGERMAASLSVCVPDSQTGSIGRESDLFRFYPKQKLWAKVLRTSLRDSLFQAKITGLGAFAFFRKRDSVPPTVDILAGKQAFFDGGYLGNHPTFTIEMRDENGLHPGEEAQKILLDGQPLTKEDSDLQMNVGPGSLVLTVSPELSAGRHELAVRGMDCMGNSSKTAVLHFRVASDFDLNVLGNYPNPFKKQTVFAYELSAPATAVSLKIYTVSGRLIRRFGVLDFTDDPDPLEPGYHEQTWDGTDGNGEDVANGVYYFKFTAKSETKTIKKTGKIVRIQ
ncbi:MAG: hypothetical protein GXO76_07145 [Calditrichaeota bacterium]|nr:hypothetical protein [Calditrichota bacterium]